MSFLFVDFFFNKLLQIYNTLNDFIDDNFDQILNSKLELIRTVKFFKQLFRIQIKKGGKVLLWKQVKSRMDACYSELVLINHMLVLVILKL